MQRENFAVLRVQVCPPSKVAALTIPFEPPLDHRSCCQTPIRCWGLVGSIAIDGSTSALGKTVPPRPGPWQELFQGALSETATRPGNVDGNGGNGAGSSQAQQSSKSAAQRRILAA